jgi:hypothetical protein
MVTPLFGHVESSLSREEADELVRRWNHFEEKPERWSQSVKDQAYKLDPECWVSYSGKTRPYKQAMEVRRKASLEAAARLLGRSSVSLLKKQAE